MRQTLIYAFALSIIFLLGIWGQYVMAPEQVQYCNEMLAVYDGEPEEGVGGTSQIVRWRNSGSPDEEFLSRSNFLMSLRSDHLF